MPTLRSLGPFTRISKLGCLVVVVATTIAISGCQEKRIEVAVEAPIFAAQVSDDGKSLTLSASADPCAQVTSTSVVESNSKVVVRLFIRRSASETECSSLVARLLQSTVRLKQALGTRALTRHDGSEIRLVSSSESPLDGVTSGWPSPTG